MKMQILFLDQFHRVIKEAVVNLGDLVVMPKSGFYVRIEDVADEQQ